MSETKIRPADRRAFLKLAGLGSVAGGVALGVKAASAAVAPATEAKGDSLGYRETEHVRTVYRLARF